MSKDYIYREARAGRLPFARKHGRRLVFDEAGLQRWLERRRPLTPTTQAATT
jgi:excisionase family DNA binding protein